MWFKMLDVWSALTLTLNLTSVNFHGNVWVSMLII